MSFCSKCGATLAPDAQFCPRCGTPVAAAPPAPAVPPPAIPPPSRPAATTSAPIQPAKRSTWWIVPLVIVGLVVVAWVLLTVLPLNRDDEERAESRPATETIAEGTSTSQGQPMTGTLIEVPGVEEPATTQTTAPPLQDTTATMAPMSPTPVPAPEPRVIEERPVPAPAPRPSTPAPRPSTPSPRPSTPAPATPAPARPAPTPAPPSPAPRAEISEAEASSTLRGYITSTNYYEGVSGSCLSIRGQGYRNVGYGFSVWDGCVSGGGSRMLGRWRVDSKTREVFRQREDGRFLRP